MRYLLIATMLAVPAAHAAYKCTDKNGRVHIGDTPPAACSDVVVYEVSPSGTVLRKIEPTLTTDQVRAKAEEALKQKEQARQEAEQHRKDVALLATYSSEKDIDTSRDLNIKPVEARIASARERMKAVEKKQKDLDDEMEFYKAGSTKSAGKASKGPPPQLSQDVERNKAEKVALEKSINGYEKEIEGIRARFDNDKKRWVALKELQAQGKLDLRSPQEIESAKKGPAQGGQPTRR